MKIEVERVNLKGTRFSGVPEAGIFCRVLDGGIIDKDDDGTPNLAIKLWKCRADDDDPDYKKHWLKRPDEGCDVNAIDLHWGTPMYVAENEPVICYRDAVILPGNPELSE